MPQFECTKECFIDKVYIVGDVRTFPNKPPRNWKGISGGSSQEDPPDEDRASKVKAALEGLDHSNNEHWTTTGKPAMTAVEEIFGGNVDRKEIEQIAPDFKRKS
jgi:hypothetical protein